MIDIAWCSLHLRDPDIGEGLSREGKMTLDILTDDWLLVVAGHVVPLDPVRVEVVEDGEAGLGAGRVLASSAVVGLGQAGAEGKIFSGRNKNI